MKTAAANSSDPELILGNAGRRFSGVTSTMLQVLPLQQKLMPLAVLGPHHLPPEVTALSFPQFVRLTRRPLPDGRPRIFHARRNKEMVMALLARDVFKSKIRIVFTSTAQRHHSAFSNFLMRRMDSLLSTSSRAASFMQIPPDRIIPHGVDLRTWHPAVDRSAAWRELGHRGDRAIGIFGRVRPSKGIDVLVEAALPLLQEDPGLSVVVCGLTIPKYREFEYDLRDRAHRAGVGDQLLFLGERPFAEVPRMVRAVTVTAALSRSEGFGLTVPESMASGTPVVASMAGAWPDMIDPGKDGFCLPVGDVDGVRSALRQLLSDPGLHQRMAAAALRKARRHYAVSTEAQRLVEWFQQLQTQKTPPSSPPSFPS